MAWTINLTHAGAFGKALGISLPHVQPLWEALMNFDLMGILSAVVGLGGLLDEEVFQEFMKLGIKIGVFTKVANTIPFKKEYSLFGFTFRVI